MGPIQPLFPKISDTPHLTIPATPWRISHTTPPKVAHFPNPSALRGFRFQSDAAHW